MNKQLLQFVCFLTMLIGITAMAMADSFTTSSCTTDFAVNDSGSFYVQSSQIPPGAVSPPGVDASSSVSGSSFHLTASGSGYSDAGVVLYFNGGLKLGDLQSMSVVSTGGPVSINLWLDTGGDGRFFSFNSTGVLTGLNGDTYGSHSGTSLDTTSLFHIINGAGAGNTYSLAQLQAGVVTGITVDTAAALWIGITNSGSGTADISGVSVGPGSGGTVLDAGGDRLVATQNADGGWGWPLAGASQQNTIGPIGMGLAKAYSRTGDAGQRTALQKAGTFLLAKTNNFSPPDGYLAAELDTIFGGNTYKSHLMTNFYNPLAAGTYNKNGLGTLYDTAGYVSLVRATRASSGIPNLAAWDLGMGLVGAASCGAGTGEWVSGVKAEINELEGDGATSDYDVIGLAGAVYGLAFVQEDFDPTSGEHAAASNLADLAAILATYQINNGGFALNKNSVTPGNESNQETSYAILAMNEVSRATFLNAVQGAANYLVSVQLATGGWDGESGGTSEAENNEVTGEALWGICAAIADTDADNDGTPDCHDGCPADPLKTAPGQCGCGIADTDSDGDGVANCNDGCPADPLKTAPGQCGCGVPDTDSDGDGTPNCHDGCPGDPLKIVPGQCGCGIADTDSDGDSVADCVDNCESVPNPLQEDVDLDGIGDACDSCIGTCYVRTDTPEFYPTIQAAYENAANGTVIQMRDVGFTENLVFNTNVSVTLQGGFNEGFTSNLSHTTVYGKLTISNGQVVVENIIIR